MINLHHSIVKHNKESNYDYAAISNSAFSVSKTAEVSIKDKILSISFEMDVLVTLPNKL